METTIAFMRPSNNDYYFTMVVTVNGEVISRTYFDRLPKGIKQNAVFTLVKE